MHALRALTGVDARRPPRNEASTRPPLYSPTPSVLNLAPVLQEKRFNWGPDPLLGSYEVDLAGCTKPDEDTVAFFGAVDSRPLLFLMSVALLSTRRFHPQAGFFILVPEEHVVPWTHLVHGWTGGAVRLLALERAAAADFGSQEGGYSRMTFHRHRVPEMLVQQGFAYSVNLDPDVLCVQPWDLRILCKVGLIAGRRVGKGSRTVEWLQQRLAGLGTPADESGLISFLNRTLGITPEALSRIPEINGGVVVFNNLRAIRERWFHTVRQRFPLLANVLEGDQDLISAPRHAQLRPICTCAPARKGDDARVSHAGMVLAASPELPRYALPSTYNYAFRRDRERLPPPLSRRLRRGMFGQAAINIHFVMDGKPWQRQNLSTYPMWLAVARMYQVYQWHQLAQALQPSLQDLHLTRDEQESLWPHGLRRPLLRAASKRSNDTLVGLIGGRTRLGCRCYLRSLAADADNDPLAALQEESRLAAPRTGGPAAERAAAALLERRRRQVQAQRRLLLRVCGGTKRSAKGEARRCSEAMETERATRLRHTEEDQAKAARTHTTRRGRATRDI